MASITEQVKAREFIITHDGMEHKFEMASYLKGLTDEILLNSEKLETWARQKGVLYGLICEGIRGDVIKQRGLVRKSTADGTPIAITDKLHEDYQRTILDHRPSTFEAPKRSVKILDEGDIMKSISAGKITPAALAVLKKKLAELEDIAAFDAANE